MGSTRPTLLPNASAIDGRAVGRRIDRTGAVEDVGRWRLPLVGCTVGQCCVEWGLTLRLELAGKTFHGLGEAFDYWCVLSIMTGSCAATKIDRAADLRATGWTGPGCGERAGRNGQNRRQARRDLEPCTGPVASSCQSRVHPSAVRCTDDAVLDALGAGLLAGPLTQPEPTRKAFTSWCPAPAGPVPRMKE